MLTLLCCLATYCTWTMGMLACLPTILSTATEPHEEDESALFCWDENSVVRSGVEKVIAKQVLRKKLSKLRHLVVKQAIAPAYLDSLFPSLLKLFNPQTVTYNGGIANVKNWKISCYLEVMEGGIPCTEPNIHLRDLFGPLLAKCNDLFVTWYRQQHSMRIPFTVDRLMTFITRYTPAPGEQALLKVIWCVFRGSLDRLHFFPFIWLLTKAIVFLYIFNIIACGRCGQGGWFPRGGTSH